MSKRATYESAPHRRSVLMLVGIAGAVTGASFHLSERYRRLRCTATLLSSNHELLQSNENWVIKCPKLPRCCEIYGSIMYSGCGTFRSRRSIRTMRL